MQNLNAGASPGGLESLIEAFPEAPNDSRPKVVPKAAPMKSPTRVVTKSDNSMKNERELLKPAVHFSCRDVGAVSSSSTVHVHTNSTLISNGHDMSAGAGTIDPMNRVDWSVVDPDAAVEQRSKDDVYAFNLLRLCFLLSRSV